MEVHGGEPTILEIIARPHFDPAFEQSLQYQASEAAVTHHAIVVLFQVRFFVGGKVNRLLARQGLPEAIGSGCGV